MLRVLATYDVDISSTLSPDALASIAQLLDTAPDLHPSDLLPRYSLTPRCALDLKFLHRLHDRWSLACRLLACMGAALSFRWR